MPETEESPTRTYRGNCHCGAFVFEFEAAEIKVAGDCNCSICSKRGYLFMEPQKPLTIIKDEGKLVHYTFGSSKIDHQFCGNCGISVIGTSDLFDLFPAGVGVNVRTIQDLDIWGLEITSYNGKAFDPPYEPPQYLGPEPNPPGFEDGKTYYGSCHCKAVTAAVRVNGSLEDGTYKDLILECNCSICRRGAYVWIYPSLNQVAIQGQENLSYYTLGNRVWRKSFCKTCGVHIGADLNPDLTADEIAALPEAVRDFRTARSDKRSLNLRILNGFDVKCVKPIRDDGWSRPPLYVNP